MTTNFKVKKIYIVVERMVGCEYSLEIIIVPLKPTFFVNKRTIAERIVQTVDGYKISRQTKYITLERMDDCYCFCDKNRYCTPKEGWL